MTSSLPRRTALLTASASLATGCRTARSAQSLKVLADTPLRPGLVRVAESFLRETGVAVEFEFSPSAAILRKLADGEKSDVLGLQPNHIADLAAAGRIAADAWSSLGRVGLGLAVRIDAPHRRIDDVDSLKVVLMEAETLITNTIVPGDLFISVLRRLGIYDQVKAKLVRVPPGEVYRRLAAGKGNEVLAGIFTLLKEAKVQVLGPLPAATQPYQSYIAVRLANANSPDMANRFLVFLSMPQAAEALADSGMEL